MRTLLTLVMATFLSACATSPSETQPQVTLHVAAFEAGPGRVEMTDPGSGRKVFVALEPVIGGDDVVSLKEVVSPNGMSAVALKLTAAAAERLGRITAERIGQPMAVLVNGKLTSAPVVRSTIATTDLMLSGASREEIHRIMHPPAGK